MLQYASEELRATENCFARAATPLDGGFAQLCMAPHVTSVRFSGQNMGGWVWYLHIRMELDGAIVACVDFVV